MKNACEGTSLILIILFVLILNSCKKGEVPSLTTSSITNILGTSATSGGTITSEGTATILTRGVCWSTGTTPTIADYKTSDGSGPGSYTSNITGLNGATVYFVRSYATNSVGTGYGMSMSFTTLGQTPSPSNSAATNITTTTATINGAVNPNYLSTVVTFDYGTTTSYGSIITASQSPTTGNTVTNVSADITGLTAGTTYHYRISSVNSLGTTYSDDITFTTLGQVPTVTTQAATKITTVGAQLNGSVNANYLSTVVTFEFGTTTNYGSIATATQSPVTGNTSTNVNSYITELTADTTYHFRVTSINSLGTTYGNDVSFTTQVHATVNDVDGNTYDLISIGTQVWMAENLKTTKYNDVSAIPNITDNTTWASLNTPAYCWYTNDSTLNKDYGALYNWFTVDAASNGGKNVCPSGWHVPSDAEWTTLTDYLTNNGYGFGGSGSNIGKSMAARGGWNRDLTVGNVGNDDASNNSSGFTALPGGNRGQMDFPGSFSDIGRVGEWWSSTETSAKSTAGVYDRFMFYNSSGVGRHSGFPKQLGFSVRCLRDL